VLTCGYAYLPDAAPGDCYVIATGDDASDSLPDGIYCCPEEVSP
jgi:hypothetical protein